MQYRLFLGFVATAADADDVQPCGAEHAQHFTPFHTAIHISNINNNRRIFQKRGRLTDFGD
ncbi:hypothetical protein HI13_contig00005-0039 [Edwardsiella piscicida]|nr:hypothetical protein HI13_contig00005-0039 [Edwardsiella piscicida]